MNKNRLRRFKATPKSVKHSRIITHRGSLWDTTGATSSEEESIPPVLQRTPLRSKDISNTSNQTEFQVPEIDKDATDYGLEFTNNFISPLQRLSSTLKAQKRRRGGQTSTNAASSSKQAKQGLPKKIPQQKSARKSTQNSVEATSSREAPRGGLQNTVRRRKNQNPISLHKKWLREVHLLQSQINFLIPKLPFARLVREIIYKHSSEITKITKTSLEALQAATEEYLTQRLQDAYLLTLHRGRVTLEVKDLQLLKFFRFEM